MVFRKKEIIAASLVLLIGMAGYLNWSYQDTVHVTDGESYIETGKKLGEAQYVSGTEDNVEDGEAEETLAEDSPQVEQVTDSGGYFEQARMNREASRSRSLEILNSTAENEKFDAETRKKAADKILQAAADTEHENTTESIAQSKGYNEICVYAEDGTANIMVRKDGFNEDDVVKLTEIATEALNISANNIKIVEVK
ncbi:MAG: SpoIIIAH-like family protein [Clostridia bacterium]|nr:SpoIIIAH-like family protein [Clostridia bacterium]